MDVLGHMSHYLWRRNDSLGGLSNSIGYLTTHSSKERMMNYFKDYFERGMLTVRSMELLEEMKSVIRDMGGIAAHGRNKDDRVIATALATVAFAEQVMPRLMALRVTKAKRAEQEVIRDEPVMQKSINNYLKAIGV